MHQIRNLKIHAKLSPRLLKRTIHALLIAAIFLFAKVLSTTPTVAQQEEGSACLYTSSQDDLKEVVLAALQSAKHSILLETFTLKDKEVLHTLRQKGEEGVYVYLVYDRDHNGDLPAFFGSKVFCHPRNVRGLMHRKILVIDESLVLAGSANMTWSSLKKDDNLLVAIKASHLAQALWQQGRSLAEGRPSSPLETRCYPISNQVIEWWSLPEEPRALQRLIELIGQAKTSIYVAMYTWTRQDLANAILDASLRGVQVHVAIDSTAAMGPAKKVVEKFQRAGIPVTISTASHLLHHKLLVIDNAICVTGSTNWTQAAFNKNEEDLLILSPLSAEQSSALSSIWKDLGL